MMQSFFKNVGDLASSTGRQAVLRSVNVAVCCLVIGCTPAPFEAGDTPGGTLRQVGDVWVLRLSGSPSVRGKAAGELLGTQIRWLMPRYAQNVFGEDGLSAKQQKTVALLRPYVPKNHLDQLRAMAIASGVDETLLLAVNLAPEVFSPMLCSCLAVRGAKSASGGMIVGRNLDWFGGQDLRHHALVVVEQGPNINTIAHVTWPGLVGVVTGINEHRVFGADLVVLGKRTDARAGLPVTFGLRQNLELSATASGAAQHLASVTRSVPQNYLFADRRKAVVIETTPERVRIRSMVDDWIAVANLQNEDKASHPRGRFRKMQNWVGKGAVTPESIRGALLDVSMGQLSVQSVVIGLDTGTLDIATTHRPAAKGPWRRIALRELFAGR